MKIILSALIAVCAAVSAQAEHLVFTLLSSSSVRPGHEARVELAALNPGARDEPFPVWIEISGRLTSGTRSWPVTLRSVGSAPVAISPRGFAARTYGFVVPVEITGRAVLTVDSPQPAKLNAVLDVTATAEPSGENTETPVSRLTTTTPIASMLSRDFAGRFMPNQPIYFIYGGGSGPAAKFQFSFDYRLGDLAWGESDSQKITTLRLGYTQRSLWEIDRASSPFYDTSYMPEIALNTDLTLPVGKQSWFKWMGYRTGFLHESNGRDGSDSRSLNTVYVRPRFVLGSLDSWVLVALPEVQVYVGGVGDNPRIKDYRGYGKLRLYLGRNDGPTLMVSSWAGADFDHATYQLDLTLPVRSRWLNIESYFLIQYFNGYGESLRAFDQKTNAIRLGISLVR